MRRCRNKTHNSPPLRRESESAQRGQNYFILHLDNQLVQTYNMIAHQTGNTNMPPVGRLAFAP
jgi:hypothetical protein